MDTDQPGAHDRREPSRPQRADKDRLQEVVDPERDEPSEPEHVFIMQGPADEVAEEVAAEGPEGKPADVRAGPRMLWSQLAIMAALVAAAAVAFGVWLGWLAGLAAMAFGLLALVFNPVVGATLNRAHDRDVVAQRRTRRT